MAYSHLVWIYFAASIVLITALDPEFSLPALCENATTTECVIEGKNISAHTIDINVNYSFIIINSIIREHACDVLYFCTDSSITISTTGNVTLINSTISAAIFYLTAAFVTIDKGSVITVAAQGPVLTTEGASDGLDGNGGGHGGTGASVYLCRALSPNPSPPQTGLGFGFSNLNAPYDFGGSSNGINFVPHSNTKSTRGGGILWLLASGAVAVSGRLCADGGFGSSITDESICKCHACACGAGGGAGGSINIVAATILIGDDGFVSAVGGDSEDSGGGGGGIVSMTASAIIGASQVK
jgi:hypothetical protein